MPPNKTKFRTIVSDPAHPDGLIGNFILSFCEEDQNKLWIGKDGEGVSVWDRSTNRFTINVFEDKDGQLWAGDFNTLILKITVLPPLTEPGMLTHSTWAWLLHWFRQKH